MIVASNMYRSRQRREKRICALIVVRIPTHRDHYHEGVYFQEFIWVRNAQLPEPCGL